MEQSDFRAEVDEALANIQRDFNLTREEAATVLLDTITYHLEGTEDAD